MTKQFFSDLLKLTMSYKLPKGIRIQLKKGSAQFNKATGDTIDDDEKINKHNNTGKYATKYILLNKQQFIEHYQKVHPEI